MKEVLAEVEVVLPQPLLLRKVSKEGNVREKCIPVPI